MIYTDSVLIKVLNRIGTWLLELYKQINKTRKGYLNCALTKTYSADLYYGNG